VQLPSFIYLERYRNEGTRTYSSHAATTEAREDYRPDSSRERFELPLFEVPRKQMVVYTANPSADLSAVYLDNGKAMFAIHPQVLDACPQDPYVQRTLSLCTGRRTLPVAPSSSTRTLFAVDRQPSHALKVHFPFRISRYDRRMRHEVLEQAINVSRELEAGIGLLDSRFAFLREVIAVCLDRYTGLCREDFTRPCKEAFASIFPEHRKYFPATVWYFSETRDRFNKPFYEDTGLAPDWRP